MIGVVIPVHNEEHHLKACLDAIAIASKHAGLQGETVQVIVVLDACSDSSRSIAQAYPFHALSVDERNVGLARAAGADFLIALGARWLAFTDADTIVSAAWLSTQLSLGKDAVCGSVQVSDWSPHGQHAHFIQAHFEASYTDADGHRHIHGANLGVSADAYLQVGGFSPLACSEDVALVEALLAHGIDIAWSAAPRVVTSARVNARASGGFGDTLLKVVSNELSKVKLITSSTA